jgi:type II secretory pathway pseudopilin PulG
MELRVRGSEFGVRGGGFTFVELLIAATMVSVLITGVGVHLKGGLTVWQRATTTAEQLQRRQVAWQRLERDLAHAVIYASQDEPPLAPADPEAPQPFPNPEFGASSLSWYTAVPAAGLRPASVRLVRYGCESVDGVEGLWRSSQTTSEARLGKTEPVRELVLPGCEALALQYAYRLLSEEQDGVYELSWDPEWREAVTTLPRLIEVTATVDGRDLQRICEIPIGVFGKPGEEPPAS